METPTAAKSPGRLYICPGEKHPISRAVHLARLAAFYPTCRQCPFRSDTGQLPSQTVRRLQQSERRVVRESLFTSEGVRGIYVNEMSRKQAGEMAAALASLLWEQSPRLGLGARDAARGEPSGERTGENARPAPSLSSLGASLSPLCKCYRPSVIVGHDERPSSPDLVTGVAAALRRMGCQVIDIGLTTRSCFWFAVDHMEATAGVFVTGAGCEPSWTGLDFCRQGGVPLSQPCCRERPRQSGSISAPSAAIDLDILERRLKSPIGRATRHAGPHRTFQASVPYEAGLWKHFHALRPLTVVCAAANRFARECLQRIFQKLPCRLVVQEVPHRVRDPLQADDPDVIRVRDAIANSRAHLGVLIDDDGQRLSFSDETGNLVDAPTTTLLLARHLLADHPQGAIILDSQATTRLRSSIDDAGGDCAFGGETLAELSQAMRDRQGILAGGNSGRYWFREAIPTCDAIVTLARMLQLLSRSDRTFSQVAGDAGDNPRMRGVAEAPGKPAGRTTPFAESGGRYAENAIPARLAATEGSAPHRRG